MKTKSLVIPDYAAFLTELKGCIASARLHAARAGAYVLDAVGILSQAVRELGGGLPEHLAEQEEAT